jgi:nucleoredoxin
MDALLPPTLDKAGGKVESFSTKDVKCIGLYFSAHWCPPCRGFTPMLADFYKEVNKGEKAIEIVFVTSDKDEESFREYFATMPWRAIPFGDPKISELKSKYGISGIPALLIFKPSGELISSKARGEVTTEGADAIKRWV